MDKNLINNFGNINFLSILEQVPDTSFALKDRSRRYLFANKEMREAVAVVSLEHIIGYSNDELSSSVVEDSLALFDSQDDFVLREKKKTDILSVFTYSGGEKKIFLGGKAPYLDETGDCIGVISQSTRINQGHLFSLGHVLFSDSLRFFSKSSLTFNISETPRQHNFSPRESECLFFILRGKTMKEIGRYLNISAKTVDYHLQQLKSKFDCHTRSQLIEKALVNGLLFFIPKSLTTIYPQI